MLLISAEPNVSQERERLVVRLQAPLPVVPSTIPAANSPKVTGRCQRRGNASSRPMIDTREITTNLAKLIRMISGVGPNNQTRPPISTATTTPCPCLGSSSTVVGSPPRYPAAQQEDQHKNHRDICLQ